MPITMVFRDTPIRKRGVLLWAWILIGFSSIHASAQVVDLPTTPLVQEPAAAPQPPVPEVQPLAPQPDPQTDVTPDIPDSLNVDPNATIDQLAPPPSPPPVNVPPPPSGSLSGAGLGSLGLVGASFSASPNMLGDFFGGGLAQVSGTQRVFFQRHAAGIILSATPPGAANGILGFEFGTDLIPNDVFTTGLGVDTVGLDGADTFVIAEPLPPNDALTSPGPGFVFDGGTAVYTDNAGLTTAQAGNYQNGELWFISYSYSRALGISPDGHGRPVPSPGVAARRVKIAENFSPEVRDRTFFNYSFFNDAFGGLGDVSRYILGAERILWDNLVSLEARLPLAGTYGSRQNLDQNASRDFELGNTTLILKGVLLRTPSLIWSGGLGVALPTADNTVVSSGGQNIIRIKNESVHLLPFLGLLVRKNRDTSFQSYIQLDVAANGDPVFGNLTGGPLPRLGKFTDSTLLHLDFAASHTFFRSQRRCVKELIGNAELHYSGTLQGSDFISAGGLTYTNLKRNFNIVNATVGMHMVLSNNLIVSPGMSVPLRSGLDEQFDYEALLQVNYLH